jgi:hypothetical protein
MAAQWPHLSSVLSDDDGRLDGFSEPYLVG